MLNILLDGLLTVVFQVTVVWLKGAVLLNSLTIWIIYSAGAVLEMSVDLWHALWAPDLFFNAMTRVPIPQGLLQLFLNLITNT